MFEVISVIGLGYIGLPTATMFASRKKKVIGVDVNQNAVDTINRGEIHIVEPDLDAIVHATVTEGYLKAKTVPEKADAFLIAVPTPFKEEYEPDLSYIESACKAIAPVLTKGNIVILESTSPVGATEAVSKWLAKERPDLSFPLKSDDKADVNIAHCPERVLPGHVVRELVENDRVVGGITPECSSKAVELYSCFVKGECFVTTARTAEMAKLTENSFRDVNIAFANELSIICDKLDINVWELINLANRHPRVNILQPGPGVGGHCIAVDPWFIISNTPKEAKLIKTARNVNDEKPNWVIQKVKEAIADFLLNNPEKTAKDIVITCYGITFKPDIDDLRESPALNVAERIVILNKGRTLIVEPNIKNLPNILSKAELVDVESAIAQADINIMLVDHKLFKEKTYYAKNLIDTKGIWEAVYE